MPEKELTLQQAEAITPRRDTLSTLGLLKPAEGPQSSCAVAKVEYTATKGLSKEENVILKYVKASENTGIWTKHLRTKTNLHPTILGLCLKSLTQKQLIKCVPSVQHPARKIYLLKGIEPATALTGGPWYTDYELDIDYIRDLSHVCLKLIRDLSFPKHCADDALYALADSPQYPTARYLCNALRNAKVSEIDLTEEDIRMLLDVLVLDGEIEKIPAHRSIRNSIENTNTPGGPNAVSKKWKETVSDSPRLQRMNASISSNDKRRGPEPREATQIERSMKRKRTDTHHGRDGDMLAIENATEGPQYDAIPEEQPPQIQHLFYMDDENIVYRAIRQERISTGWVESPCFHCPSFDLCKASGPMDPQHCKYYHEWLQHENVSYEM